jgi:CBS domain-containing protein
MQAREIMTPGPRCVSTAETVETVARLMRDTDCGSIPVVDPEGKLLGIVTDRDLAVRCLANRAGPDTPVSDAMTSYPFTAKPDDNVRSVEKLMAERQVRRVPIVDGEGHCVGIISQGDLARVAAEKPDVVSDRQVAIVVERISSPKPARLSDPRYAETIRIDRTDEHRQQL